MKFLIDGDEYQFDQESMTFGEGGAVERAFGGSIKAFGEALEGGSISAVQILMWTILRRTQPGLKLADLDARPIVSMRQVDDEVPAEETPAVDGAPSPTDAPPAGV